MKYSNFKALVIGLLLTAGLSVTSCKSKPKDTTNDTPAATSTATEPTPAPVEISGDESLKTGVTDATKDYPGVVATVSNGEVTLTGEIERSRLQNLMQSVNTLNAKKINNQLTIK